MRSAPEILEKVFRDGSTFRASDSFVRGWLHDALEWSPRKATRAAQKHPDDWKNQCEKALLRKAYLIKEHDIPPSLFVNSDQTNVVYAPGDKMTWTDTGSNQVSLVGVEEKRAFTTMVSVASNGTLLPFQAIYQGKSDRSCPNRNAPYWAEAEAAGIRFHYSGTGTYWSNQELMQVFVNEILAPYFDREKINLGLPPGQVTLWLIDVWSVHRSKEFCDWMAKNHPNIQVDFVPGGCTSVAQPCDVGIQRPFKLSVKRSYHEDIVSELLEQIDGCEEGQAVTFHFKDQVGFLRDRSVRWLWNAFNAVNKPALVKKVSDIPSILSYVGLIF